MRAHQTAARSATRTGWFYGSGSEAAVGLMRMCVVRVRQGLHSGRHGLLTTREELSTQEFAIHAGDVRHRDILGTLGFAFILVGTVAKAGGIHGFDH
jgi:hypothetical protein